jgi:hypothetical protein
VAVQNGVDRLAGAEADAVVLLGEVELGFAVAQERDLAGVAVLVEDAALLERGLRRSEYSFLMVLKQCGQAVTIFLMLYPFST